MKTLTEVRTEIDRVDQEIRRLFEERMALAGEVARVKAKTGDCIYKPEREEQILTKRCEGMAPELTGGYRALLKRLMEVSRLYQYGLVRRLRGEQTAAPDEPLFKALAPGEHAVCPLKVSFVCPSHGALPGILSVLSAREAELVSLSTEGLENGMKRVTVLFETRMSGEELRTLLALLSEETREFRIINEDAEEER